MQGPRGAWRARCVLLPNFRGREAEEMSEVLMLQWVKAGLERASSPSKISYWKDHCGWGREGGVSFNRGLPQWFIKGPTCASRRAQGQREATMFLKFDWSRFYHNNLKPTSVDAVTPSCPSRRRNGLRLLVSDRHCSRKGSHNCEESWRSLLARSDRQIQGRVSI
ncbi:hypothetical protein DFH06DRAFT_1243272 [Mycena polygramma]|nr:hypothetical protein DFH06DRAFT_1243272 [Mycena polygramma]